MIIRRSIYRYSNNYWRILFEQLGFPVDSFAHGHFLAQADRDRAMNKARSFSLTRI